MRSGVIAGLLLVVSLPQVVWAEEKPGFSRVIDEDEVIYAVQRKAYLLKGKFELSAMYNTLVGDRFVTTENSFGVAGSVGYHLTEQFALELFGGVFRPTESETTEELSRELGLLTENAKLTQLLWGTGLGVQWSPIYGKFQFAGRSIGNFSFYLGMGVGFGQSRVQCIGVELLDPNEFQDEACRLSTDVAYEPARLQFIGSFNSGFRLRFRNWLGFRAEVRDYIFSSRVYRPESQDRPPFSDSVRNNLYLQFGLSFLLGGESN